MRCMVNKVIKSAIYIYILVCKVLYVRYGESSNQNKTSHCGTYKRRAPTKSHSEQEVKHLYEKMYFMLDYTIQMDENAKKIEHCQENIDIWNW